MPKKSRVSGRILRCAMALAVFGVLPNVASAQAVVTTAPGAIVRLQSDWTLNSVIVALPSNVPLINPAACTLTDAYETHPSDAGTTLNNSILLSAYLAHANVALVIQGCSPSNRPRIISVAMPN